MSRTVKVWHVYGAPKQDLGCSLTFYAATKADAQAIVREYDMDADMHQIEVELSRYGVAQAMQAVVEENCLNQG